MHGNETITMPNGLGHETKIKLIRLEETDSTNNFLRTLSPEGDADMVVATAEHQTAGRGQGTNTWESQPSSNLLFSVLTRPHGVDITRQFVLSMAEALAVKAALVRYTDGITLKWPNDIYWNDRKICGTLIETSVSHRTINRCIFGTGININQRTFTSDAPNPVSLAQITGHDADREEILCRFLEAFVRLHAMATNGGADTISQLYHDALYRRTGFHAYRDKDGAFMAQITHVDQDGRLHLTDDNQRQRDYTFKEIQFII